MLSCPEETQAFQLFSTRHCSYNVPNSRSALVTQRHGSAAAGSDEMEENLAAFDLAEKIHNALEGLTGSNYRDMSLVQTQTNHNHEEIFENIETYKVHYKWYLNDE